MTDSASNAFPPDPRIHRILEIFAKETGVEVARLSPGATLQELGVESLDLTMAVFQLEESFDIEIPVVAESAGMEFNHVGDLVSHVVALLDQRAEGAGRVETQV